jgi:cobalamin biosynthetic protein CobC
LILAKNLQSVNGLLVIDEAFIDCENSESAWFTLSEFSNVVILRSMGKFFGLAGIRVGFIIASEAWLLKLKAELGIWTITGASLAIAEQALKDISWQQSQRLKLKEHSARLKILLIKHFSNVEGTYLFKTVKTSRAIKVHESLCQQGILVRLCDEKDALRFGTPDERGNKRLSEGLGGLS